MTISTINHSSLLLELDALKKRVAELELIEKNNHILIQSLNKRKDILKRIFLSAPAGMGMLHNRVFEEVNPLLSKLTGYSREEIVGRSSRFLYNNQEDFDRIGTEHYNELLQVGIGVIETLWKRKDGLLIDVLLSSTPIDPLDLTQGIIFTAHDITAQKRAQEVLQNSEERLKIIFEYAPDAIYLTNMDGCILDGNKAVENLLLYTKEQLIGKNIFELNLLTDTSKIEAFNALQKNSKGLKAGPDLYELKTKQGDLVSVEITSYPISIKGEKLILGIARDITERQEQENLRSTNEQRMALHINQTPLAVIEWDLNFCVKTWNPSAERIFGYTEKEAFGKHASFIVPESDHMVLEKIWRDATMFKDGGQSTNRNRNKNGDLLWCEWYNTPLINEEGKVIAVTSLGMDITERIRSEEIKEVIYHISNATNTTDNLKRLIREIQEELSRIIDTTNFFIALYDKNSDTLSLPFFADEQDHFTNFPVGKTLTGYVINSKKPLLATKALIEELENRGEVESVGSDCEIWLGVPLKIENEVIGVLAVQSYSNPNEYNQSDMKVLEFVADQISLSIHRKNSELEMICALEKATEADRLKSAFLANMSHEIRTPMNGILGFSSLLKNDNLNDEDRNKYVNIIEKSGNRMLGIINDLIDISKIEAGITQVVPSDFNLNNSIEYVFSFFQPEANAKGIELTRFTELDNDKALINSDREKVYAILINLVKNAIKYTKTGTINMGYTIENDIIRFSVKDTGIGIPQNKLGKIFNRFEQVDLKLSSSYEGVGLGLSITQAYVNLMGGTIKVESELGVGSTFYCELPYIKGTKKQTQYAPLTIFEDNTMKKLKILVAEDDSINQKLISYMLKELTGQLVIVNNGAEAVKFHSDNPDIDLILMDIKMPEMDGYEATKIIRETDKDIVIIALSAFSLENEKDKTDKIGFTDYIPKPINKAGLATAIARHFQV
jgi:PAS domain S-box-containing protein